MTSVTATCICDRSPASEGPEIDCPSHGAQACICDPARKPLFTCPEHGWAAQRAIREHKAETARVLRNLAEAWRAHTADPLKAKVYEACAEEMLDHFGLASGGTEPAHQPPPLAEFAAEAACNLGANFPENDLSTQQVLCLAEEVGEFVAAYRRWAGMARRTGEWADVQAELADVVITAYVTADVLGIDLDAAWWAKAEQILTRGWKEPKA